MATVTITAIAFEDPSLVTTFSGQLGEANGAAHKPMYKKAADGKFYLTNSSTSAETSGESGLAISLQEGQIDEYIEFLASGRGVIAEGTFTQGEVYIVGGTAAGDINEVADAATPNWFMSTLFIAGSTSGASNRELIVAPVASGVTA
jgi:hypothetical protein